MSRSGINTESLGGEGGAERRASQGGFEDHSVPISSPTVPGPDGALPRPESQKFTPMRPSMSFTVWAFTFSSLII